MGLEVVSLTYSRYGWFWVMESEYHLLSSDHPGRFLYGLDLETSLQIHQENIFPFMKYTDIRSVHIRAL